MRIDWTVAAQNDLRQIHSYIARDSRAYASRMIDRIRRSVERMQSFPEAGNIVPEFEMPELRQIFVQSYRVIYRVHHEGVVVLAIVHGARNLPDTFAPP